jgi:PEP-CTERM motif
LKSFFRLTTTALALAATLSAAQAQTVTFANFTQDVGAAKVFNFLNTGEKTTSGFFTQPTTVQVNFFFLMPTGDPGIVIGTPLTASLTITSQTLGNANVGVVTVAQKLQNLEMRFIGVGGTVDGKNLLTITASTGTLGGELGAATAGLEETDNGITQFVNYSSDYLSFSSSTQRNYSISLNNLSPSLAKDPNGFLSAFTSNATGQFAANQIIVPEPSTVVFVGLGVLGLLVGRRNVKSHC